MGFGMLVTAMLAATVGLLLLSVLQRRLNPLRGGVFADLSGGTEFLFDGDTLIDATPGGRALLASSSARGGAWHRLVAYLSPRFPDLEQRIGRLPADGRITLASGSGPGPALMLRAEVRGGLMRLTVTDTDSDAHPLGQDNLTVRANADELDQLRCVVARAPLMMWRERADGAVVWANAAYLNEATERLGPDEDLAWPLPRLFNRVEGDPSQRARLEGGTSPGWFDLVRFPEKSEHVVFALPADGAVQAENALRDFMQTLTKTFAHLPIGLAIFDRTRQLQLFNPALTDLTGLQAEFLTLRPSLFAMLDAMRDRSMIPEPKDYSSWRKQMAALEKAASSGLFEETWSLPGGQTYRVIGRPHPNGALALMFEDISTEVSRARRYRADLELGQSVFDMVDDGIAVFSQEGLLVMSNAAYGTIWGHDPASKLESDGIATICSHWRSRSAPSQLWKRVEDYLSASGERRPWAELTRLSDGRLLACRFAPLTGGATMASFRIVGPSEASQVEFSSSRRRKSA